MFSLDATHLQMDVLHQLTVWVFQIAVVFHVHDKVQAKNLCKSIS